MPKEDNNNDAIVDAYDDGWIDSCPEKESEKGKKERERKRKSKKKEATM